MSELNLSLVTAETAKYLESETLARHGISVLLRQLGPNSSMIYYARIHLGDALRGQKRYAEAESLLLSAYKRFETPKPITYAWHMYSLLALVRLYEAQGRVDETAKYRALFLRDSLAKP